MKWMMCYGFKKNTALHNVVLFQVFPQNSLSVAYREKKWIPSTERLALGSFQVYLGCPAQRVPHR